MNTSKCDFRILCDGSNTSWRKLGGQNICHDCLVSWVFYYIKQLNWKADANTYGIDNIGVKKVIESGERYTIIYNPGEDMVRPIKLSNFIFNMLIEKEDNWLTGDEILSDLYDFGRFIDKNRKNKYFCETSYWRM